ncbi:MAG: replicative DNA helicase, partial [Bacteroidetes bacterium]|nr:replicative DNA helicase [Bacteroidota bacterium]
MESKNYQSNKGRGKKTTTTPMLMPEQGKLPPQATDLEEAVLGALMLEKDALTQTIEIISPGAFYKETHQKIFTAIKNLFGKSEPVDMLTVTNELRRTGELEEIGGAYYIAQLTSRVASAANVEYHSRIIMQKFLQRELIRISTEIISDAYDDTTDVFELLDKAERNLFEVTETNIRRREQDMAEIIKKAIEQVETASRQEGNLSGIPSGFAELDKVTAGWQKSDLVIIAARPGMGKTAFVLSMARNIAVDFEKPVAFFSLEMSATQLVTRLISSESEIEQDTLRKGTLSKEQWNKLHSRIRQLTEAPIFIDDTPALSIFELRAKCRRMKAQHDIQLVVVDYLQLMK